MPGINFDIVVLGTGLVTVASGESSGVSVFGTPGLKLRTQYSAASLLMLTDDSWLLAGDLVE